MPLNIGSTAGGSVTLSSGSTASATTLTLPAVNGTVLTTATTLTVAQGGTGAATLAANNVLLGNGTSALQTVAPGASGNLLTSNGTTWSSSAPVVTGVTSLAAGSGVSVSGSTGAVTVTNTGVTSAAASTGISVSGSTGGVTFTNTGVTSATAGTGINVSGGTGAVTFTNAGVTSIVAGSNVSISGSTGAVTISASNVTSITAGDGLTGGTITGSGTIAVSTTVGAVGTHAFLWYVSGGVIPGGDVTSTGGNLFYSNINGDTYNYPTGLPSGQVWRCLGYGNNAATLYIRIS